MYPEIKTGTYRHYKGNLYVVIGVARHSETEEFLVVYHPMQSPDQLWVRPLSMFTETIPRPDHPGSLIPRFEYLKEAETN